MRNHAPITDPNKPIQWLDASGNPISEEESIKQDQESIQKEEPKTETQNEIHQESEIKEDKSPRSEKVKPNKPSK